MNKLTFFDNPEFGTIRVVGVNGDLWLVGKDVATALDYERPTKAIVDHVDEEDRKMVDGKTQSQFGIELGQRGGWLINESGLYSLVLSSKLPGAKRFKHWVTSEVLPSIRKHGGYVAGQEGMTDDELLARAVMVAQSKIEARDKLIEEQQRKIEAMRPKEVFANAVTASRATILVGELAKILKQNGVDIGQNRLFKWLRENGYLIRRQGTDYNMPTQRSMEMGPV